MYMRHGRFMYSSEGGAKGKKVMLDEASATGKELAMSLQFQHFDKNLYNP